MRLSATDAAFLYAESASGPMHISSVYVLEGQLAYETVFEHLQQRLHLIPAYRRKIAFVPLNLGHPKWIDDPDFDLANHVIHHQLPSNASFEEALDLAISLNEPMLDRSRPLWETHVITGLAEQTLILHITHHSLIDGASGMELIQVIYDINPNPAPVEQPSIPWQAEEPASAANLLQEAWQENIEGLQKFRPSNLWPSAGDQRDLMRHALSLITSFITRPAITAPFNAAAVGPKRRVRFLKRPFGEIREIRRAFGGTINDVVLTVVSEAVARYLEASNENTENAHLRIMCPVNVRTEDQKGALGNQVSAIFPMLPAWPMAIRSRLGVVCAETEHIKQNEDAQAMTLASQSANGFWPLAMAPTQLVGTPFDPTAFAARLPLPRIPNIGWRPPNPGVNFICTNVPGVQVPLYLAGHKVTDTIGVLILSGNIGFSATVLSYNKELFINYICEPRLLPELDLIVDSTAAAFDELLTEARAHSEQLSGN